MRNTALFLITLALLAAMPACKKQQTIYEFLEGNWGYPAINHNGVLQIDSTGETNWAIYFCNPSKETWCSSIVLYRSAPNYNTAIDYKVSADERWMLIDKSTYVDSLLILKLTTDEFVYQRKTQGVTEVASWLRL